MLIIFDTRLANMEFVAPPKTRLASAAAFGALELECLGLYVASGNIKNAFYCMGLPLGLDKHFVLPSVRAGDVGISDLDGVAIGANTMISPCLCVFHGLDLGAPHLPVRDDFRPWQLWFHGRCLYCRW